MKRSINTTQWIRSIRTKDSHSDDPRQQQTTNTNKQITVTILFPYNVTIDVPMWIARLSSVLDHVNPFEEIPLMADTVVTPDSIQDCISLYEQMKNSKLLGHMWDSDEAYWRYSHEIPRMRLITRVYRWRRRLGMLLATSGFFGWTHIQDLVDCIIRQRVSTSWASALQTLIFSNMSDIAKATQILDFFTKKLSFDRIHKEMFTSWISKRVLNEWFAQHSVCSPHRAASAYHFLTSELNFVLNTYTFSRGDAISFVAPMFRTVYTEHDFEGQCELFQILSSHNVPAIHGKHVHFSTIYAILRVVWQLPDTIFDEFLRNLSTVSQVSMTLLPYRNDYEAYRQSYIDYNKGIHGNERAVERPSDLICNRWISTMKHMSVANPEEMLDNILLCFPRYVQYCIRPLF